MSTNYNLSFPIQPNEIISAEMQSLHLFSLSSILFNVPEVIYYFGRKSYLWILQWYFRF